MSRILFLSQLLPFPLNTGPKVRSYYVLRHLTQKHQVTLLAFSRPDDPPEAVQHLREFCEKVHLVMMHRSQARNVFALIASMLAGESFTIRRDYRPKMAQTVDRLLQTGQYDAVHADQLWMAQYALRAKGITHDTKLVLDEHNACFQVTQRLVSRERNPFMRLLFTHEWRRLRAYEAETCASFDHVVTVTQEDQSILKGLIHSSVKHTRQQDVNKTNHNFVTIPICVDTQSTAPVQPNPGAVDVLHLGTMFWLPNVEGVLWFAREVWPAVVAQVPQATFTIVGKNPPTEIRALSMGQKGMPSIQVTGYIPDPQPYLKRAGVFIVPLLSGGGMRVKIVDGWRWGLPIISTRIGAEGIDYHEGENILIADDPGEFSQAIVRVLRDPLLAQRLRVNGRRWVEEKYEWRRIYPAWDSIYNSDHDM